jgi:hypothetical protein
MRIQKLNKKQYAEIANRMSNDIIALGSNEKSEVKSMYDFRRKMLTGLFYADLISIEQYEELLTMLYKAADDVAEKMSCSVIELGLYDA